MGVNVNKSKVMHVNKGMQRRMNIEWDGKIMEQVENFELVLFRDDQLRRKKFTAVGQAVACAPVTQRARVRSPVGTCFLGKVFFGVFPNL